jgi:TolB-like protein/tetratricopeptide (TPR) repeat protein
MPGSRIVPPAEQLLDDVADAVLDGMPIDWTAAESSAGAAGAGVIRQLRLLESVARLQRGGLASATSITPAPVVPARVPERWGDLRVLERIGGGAFGDVFRAWDARLDREVALKILSTRVSSPEQADAIVHEGRLLARVRHPNVVTIHGADQIGDQIGLWMELVRGQTLDQLVRQGRRFSADDVTTIGLELSRALAAVHAAGLLHRDIKAHNVSRADDGRIVLMDFGTGREVGDQTSDLAGTPLYLAPEVLAGQPATVQSDLYSLGVLLFYLLTGAYPVTGRTFSEVRQAHERNARPGLRALRPDTRPGLARLIERAIDPRPERRYANAEALAKDLSALQRRPLVPPMRYAIAAAAAVVLVAVLASEIHARLTGDRRSLRARFASALGLAPDYFTDPRIAVMPFKTISDEARNRLLVDNVTSRLIQQLGIIDGLSVRSQTSSFQLKDQPRNLDDIARRLNVNLVLDGEAQLSGNTLRISAALVSVSGDPVWSDTVIRTLSTEGDVGEVVDNLTRQIVNAFRLKLGPTQRRYTTDIPTFEIYLKARALRDARLNRYDDAIPLFQDVIRRDPSFAPARVALAAVYSRSASNFPTPSGAGLAPGEAAALMTPHLQQAQQVDPMLGELHAAFGGLYSMTGRWTQAEASYRRAIELEPTLASIYGDFVLDTLLPWGRADDAVAVMREALSVDPLSADARRLLARAQVDAADFDGALENCTLVLQQDPEFLFADAICGFALMFKGRTDEALALFNKRRAANEGWIGYLHAITGRRADAEALRTRNLLVPQRVAVISAGLGDADRAFAALEALAARNPRRAALFFSTPHFAKLRDDPRAAVFRQKLGFPR